MSASNHLETAILEHNFRANPQASPQTLWLALYISNPTDEDTGTEVTGVGYARQQVSFGSVQQIGGKATVKNSSKIEFPIAGGAWGVVAYTGVRDAANGGNLLAHAPLTASKDIQANDQMVFPVGELTVTVS